MRHALTCTCVLLVAAAWPAHAATLDGFSEKQMIGALEQGATAKAKVKQAYDAVVKQATKYHLMDAGNADLDAWVTNKALDGLFLTIADNERAIRKDPLGQTRRLLRDVFGALKR